jgi:hydroxymethylpyrimidine/phosphomethylpyrimidine kinase
MTVPPQPSSDHRSTRTRTVLTIAGSDSGGGAGVQADLKAFARCGVHGTTAITAVTAQNTVGVSAIHPLPAEVIIAQVRAVAEDIGVDAVKVGMLGTTEVALAVARALAELPASVPVVVDPVMVAESGAQLLDAGAQRALAREILPRATVLTPNLPEARVLTGSRPEAEEEEGQEAETMGRKLLSLGPEVVVITGGHRSSAVDLFFDSEEDGRVLELGGERHPDGGAHGSGCTHSSVLAAQLALGFTPLQAARTARAFTGEAVKNGLRDIGAGVGPVDVLGLGRMGQL